MKELHLTEAELLEYIANGNVVGQGTMGILYEMGEDEIFKFCFKDFIDEFEVKGNKFNLKKFVGNLSSCIEDRKMIDRIVYRDGEKAIVKTVREMAVRQSNMKYNQLPRGVVYVNDYPVGFILTRQRGMVNLYDYIMANGLTDKEVDSISQSLSLATRELSDNYIYHFDLTSRNVLYKPSTMATQIVDFEDSVRVCSHEDRGYSATMFQELWEIDRFMKGHRISSSEYSMDTN